MKFRSFTLLVFAGLLVVGLALFLQHVSTAHGLFAVAAVLLALNSLPLAFGPSHRLGATLVTTEILQDVLDGFKLHLPALSALGVQFQKSPIILNQPLIAHVAGVPTTAAYDPTTGYLNGVQEANSLLTDVPLTPNLHRHVPLRWKHLNNIQEQKHEYDKVIRNASYALAKYVIDTCLGLVTSRNFSQATTEAVADCDSEMLGKVTTAMNLLGAGPMRNMFVNSPVAAVLNFDGRIASADYAGQQQGGEAYRHFTNTHGFQNIFEYPGIGPNNGSAITLATSAATDDIIDTAAPHGLLAGDRVVFPSLSGGTGLAADGTIYHVIAANLGSTTFQVSATAGGSAVNFSADITAGTVQLAENLLGFATDGRAIPCVFGAPEDFGAGLAQQLGVTQIMNWQALTDADTGITMAAVSWQQPGTGDVIWSPVIVGGAAAGKQASTAAAGSILDYAGHRLISA